MKKQFKPGPGWKQLNPVVWEKNLIRIHISGQLIRVNNQYVGMIPHRHEILRFIKINSGNKKRGLMVYANNLYGVNNDNRI